MMGRMFIVCSRVVGNTTKNVYLYACVAMSLANVSVVLFISFFSVSPVSNLFHTFKVQGQSCTHSINSTQAIQPDYRLTKYTCPVEEAKGLRERKCG